MTLPELKVGQIWQCRKQEKVVLIRKIIRPEDPLIVTYSVSDINEKENGRHSFGGGGVQVALERKDDSYYADLGLTAGDSHVTSPFKEFDLLVCLHDP